MKWFQNIWFKKMPMGKNIINGIMKKMKQNSPLNDLCPEKKITNHGAWKTVVKKLKSSRVPKCKIKNILGYTSAEGLNDYNSGDERKQQMISDIIYNSSLATLRGVLNQLYSARPSVFPSSASCQVYNFNYCSVMLNIVSDNSAQKHLCPGLNASIV